MLAVSALASGAAQGQARSSDIVIKGGTIYTGSSSKGLIGDVAISGDRIVYVGPSKSNPYNGRRVINASAMIVAPGFIDPHTHADTFLTGKDPTTRTAGGRQC